jgi:SAM domain (Sterile alpha motif)
MDVVVWLRSLGLGQYEAAFRENEVDDRILPKLTVAEPRVPHILASLWR